jgi:hypothetical protein
MDFDKYKHTLKYPTYQSKPSLKTSKLTEWPTRYSNKVYIRELEDTLLLLLDCKHPFDIQGDTGMPYENCEKIYKLYRNISDNRKNNNDR